ncbi:MAG: CvpA family protein [Lachnospiraceae bacterium]|nr:CvpA family protein [Lachnospiraceae bacterium]
MTRVLLSLLVTVVFGGIYFYIKLPALNIHNRELYTFVILLCVVFAVCMVLLQGFRAGSAKEYMAYTKKNLAVPLTLVILAVAVMVVGSLFGFIVFRAKAYSELMAMNTGDFAAEVSEIGWNQIPLLDENSANNLANRKLGELSDLVSQFAVDDASAQINYQGHPVRLNYLNYNDFFKWWNNRGEGIPAYVRIDMRTQEVEVVRLEEGIKYSPSEYFSRDLMRHLRFSYPTLMFDDVNFEINDDGTPYWIASVIEKRIGLFDGTDIKGAVLVNAVTGDTEYYDIENVPTWVDRVYSADLIVEQYDYYGEYHNGFWNSIFGQTDCTETTDGYNFIAQDDDVWVYTGVTSVTGDRGNIGFILVNQRTKEAHYYSCAGAEEYSAMSSAEGAVQQFSYGATFPLLLNISDQPTYFMALKDAAGLVKMYAMVNVQQYQIVATGNTVADCQRRYHELLVENQILSDEEIAEPEPEEKAVEVSGKVEEIRSADMDGNTVYFIRLEKGKAYYMVSAKDYPEAVILDVGDDVTVTHYPTEDELIEAVSFEMKK